MFKYTVAGGLLGSWTIGVFAYDEWIQTLLSPLQRRWGRGKG